ncbi:putative membrane protein [Desulfohalotomaculum tongense]|uniref:hypothetical protein n=1 Tax=Desulforadius tongensis TaxID=1216062 RepID=UPI00195C32C8|nr:hypothetical protein [Desulforadius tongensis]MBM7855865.1 putative membrane protein [Desulforadius tongensis]
MMWFCGPMFGWIIFPLFFLICIAFMFLFMNRYGLGGYRGISQNRSGQDNGASESYELIKEVRQLRKELDELRQK